MLNILFICHGNICRSPTAEFVMKKLVKDAGLDEAIYVESAATSTEELGNPVYPPARKMLAAHGLDCKGKTARQITADDVEEFDLIIGMDDENMYMLRRRFGSNAKFKMLLDYAGRAGQEVFDPWYTRDFERSYRDILAGCEGLMEEIITIDFTECETKKEMFAVLRREMEWQDWYGENLDALHDIVTGLPHRGNVFAVIPPVKEELKKYAEIIETILKND